MDALQYESIGALIRSRLVSSPGYRGQRRTQSFLQRLLKLGLWLAARQHRNRSWAFPVDRRAIAGSVGIPEHAVRSALACLEELGLLESQGEACRKPNGPHYAPRQWRFAQVVRDIFWPVTRPEEPRTLREEEKEGKKDRPQALWAGLKRVASTVLDLEPLRALLRLRSPSMSEEEIEREIARTPDRQQKSPQRRL